MASQGNTISYPAYGKINLGLDVVRRLENGYHEVRMIMQTVSLHDVVTMKVLSEDEIRIHTNSGKIPSDENNLAFKAAKLMKDQYNIAQGVDIYIEKNIPVAAGMAGGSTDCAAVLKGMNALFELGLTQKQLREEGVKLGADVPYCIMGGTARAEGIGEKLTPIPAAISEHVLVIKPVQGMSTPEVYRAYDREADAGRVLQGAGE